MYSVLLHWILQAIVTQWYLLYFVLWGCDPTRVMASSFLRFLDHTQRRSTVGRTPLDERSARRRDLYVTTHNNHNRQIAMPPVGFEPTISAGEWPQTYALDRTATGTGNYYNIIILWDHRRICGPSLTETSLCGAYLYSFLLAFIQLLVYLFIYVFIYLFTYLVIYLFIY